MTLTQADYAFITDFVRQRSSIDLQPGKEYLVESRLKPLARETGAPDLAAVVSRLRRGDRELAAAVVDAMTTNETSWFRDNHPFDAFSNHVLPALKEAGNRRLTVWSAACSSGQEAYSLAMLLLDWLPANPGYSAQIIGTDISPTMIARARAGRYSHLEVNRGMRASYLVRHFQQQGREWVIKPEAAALCTFQEGNLAQPPVGIPTADVVFLRNVLIYFDIATKRQVLANVRRVLRPGGFLVLGGAESTLNLDTAFHRMEMGRAVVYQHTGGGL